MHPQNDTFRDGNSELPRLLIFKNILEYLQQKNAHSIFWIIHLSFYNILWG